MARAGPWFKITGVPLNQGAVWRRQQVPTRLCPLHPEGGQGGELARVESVAALLLVDAPVSIRSGGLFAFSTLFTMGGAGRWQGRPVRRQPFTGLSEGVLRLWAVVDRGMTTTRTLFTSAALAVGALALTALPAHADGPAAPMLGSVVGLLPALPVAAQSLPATAGVPALGQLPLSGGGLPGLGGGGVPLLG